MAHGGRGRSVRREWRIGLRGPACPLSNQTVTVESRSPNRARCGRWTAATMLGAALAGVSAAAFPPFQPGFPVNFTSSGTKVLFASVAVGDLDGDGYPDLVVGDASGRLQAYRHDGVKLWHFATASMGIPSKAAIADLDADGQPEVVTTTADANTQGSFDGGVWVLERNGVQSCVYRSPFDFNGDGKDDGFWASPAVADLDRDDGGRLEIALAGWDGHVTVLNHDCSTKWTRDVRETQWASPAIADVDRDGTLDVIVGLGTHFDGPPYDTVNGGTLRVYRGSDGVELAGFGFPLDEVLASPSVGDLDGDGRLEILAGVARCWDYAPCASGGQTHPVTEVVYAWKDNGQPLPGWPYEIPGEYTDASPALADIDEDGELEVVLNTIVKSPVAGVTGRIYAINADGTDVAGWPVVATVPTGPEGQTGHPSSSASPVVADVNGDGHLEVLVSLGSNVVVFDRHGVQLSWQTCCPPAPAGSYQLDFAYTTAGTAAVADLDRDGDVELAIGEAAAGGDPGRIVVWDLPGVPATRSEGWPVHRGDEWNSGHARWWVFKDGFETGDSSRWSIRIP